MSTLMRQIQSPEAVFKALGHPARVTIIRQLSNGERCVCDLVEAVGLGWSTASKVVFDSWDRFILPLPFSRGVIVYTKPMLVPREANPAELEACRAEFERRLNEATREADLACGGPVIKPADPTPCVASGDAAEPAA